MIGLLLALYAFGIGKAALMPLHFWLPAAMVAPTPVSALLHAVAVVKAGVFTIVKVVVYMFGTGVLAGNGSRGLARLRGVGEPALASLVALTRDNLKARLAYSTVSQLAYVVLGAALANATSIIGSGLHIATHAAGKITLFFCAGAIYTALHKTEISDMTGIGRKMPITMTAFLIGSLSIIGLPPFGGTWSKWTLALGALEAGHAFVVGVLMMSSVLSAAYLLPIVARAFFLPSPPARRRARRLREAPAPCVIALCLTALLVPGCCFSTAGAVQTLLEGIFATPATMSVRTNGRSQARRWQVLLAGQARQMSTRLVWSLYVVCALLLAIDVFVPKHGPFAIEHVFGFYGLFGFIACVVLVLVAKQLRRVLMRPEDYYDR